MNKITLTIFIAFICMHFPAYSSEIGIVPVTNAMQRSSSGIWANPEYICCDYFINSNYSNPDKKYAMMQSAINHLVEQAKINNFLMIDGGWQEKYHTSSGSGVFLSKTMYSGSGSMAVEKRRVLAYRLSESDDHEIIMKKMVSFISAIQFQGDVSINTGQFGYGINDVLSYKNNIISKIKDEATEYSSLLGLKKYSVTGLDGFPLMLVNDKKIFITLPYQVTYE